MELYDVMRTTFACREFTGEGYGVTMTTWGIAEEAEVKALLDKPPHWAVATIMPLGKPVKQLTKLKRKPIAGPVPFTRVGALM